jgi:hypothetical protein
VEVVEQLSVFLENKPGVLARVCRALAEAGINLRALSVSDTVDHAVVRFIPDDAGKARDILEKGGALVVETDVLCVEREDHPGALAVMAEDLAKASVNIEYAYGSTASGAGVLVLRVDDIDAARRALGGSA